MVDWGPLPKFQPEPCDRAECEDVWKLLEEATDWLCPHTEAAQQKKEHPDIRAWCCDCHNYLRLPEDATLYDRVQAMLQSRKESSRD